MLKRYKKVKTNGVASKPVACSSNNTEKSIRRCDDLSSSVIDSGVGKPDNETSTNERYDLVNIFSTCGLRITEESSNILRKLLIGNTSAIIL